MYLKSAPLINFIFCLRKIFLMWVGGSTGAARAPNNPLPPPGSLSKRLVPNGVTVLVPLHTPGPSTCCVLSVAAPLVMA